MGGRGDHRSREAASEAQWPPMRGREIEAERPVSRLCMTPGSPQPLLAADGQPKAEWQRPPRGAAHAFEQADLADGGELLREVAAVPEVIAQSDRRPEELADTGRLNGYRLAGRPGLRLCQRSP